MRICRLFLYHREENMKGSDSMTERPVRMWLASDIHYYSPHLTDMGEAFQNAVFNSDGKMTGDSDEILEVFLEKAGEAKPDVLILSGDLTFNGEHRSHTDLIDKLSRLQDKGIPVLVIPGNHDIANARAVRFSGAEMIPCRSMTAEEFRRSYRKFGPERSICTDAESFSYIYEVRSDLWILMVDTNSDGSNLVGRGTLEWIRRMLETAQDKKIRVIAVSHQNLEIHNSVFWRGFVIENHEELKELYKQFGVVCNFSGHMHMQHIRSQEEVPEAATACLTLSPHRFAKIECDGKKLQYYAIMLDVRDITSQNSSKGHVRTDFAEYASTYDRRAAYTRALQSLESIDKTQEEKEIMAAVFAELHYSYFAGNRIDLSGMEEGIRLWKEVSGAPMKNYVLSIVDEEPADHHYLCINMHEYE